MPITSADNRYDPRSTKSKFFGDFRIQLMDAWNALRAAIEALPNPGDMPDTNDTPYECPISIDEDDGPWAYGPGIAAGDHVVVNAHPRVNVSDSEMDTVIGAQLTSLVDGAITKAQVKGALRDTLRDQIHGWGKAEAYIRSYRDAVAAAWPNPFTDELLARIDALQDELDLIKKWKYSDGRKK